MLFQHLCRIVRPLALSYGFKASHFRRQIKATDAGEQGEVSKIRRLFAAQQGALCIIHHALFLSSGQLSMAYVVTHVFRPPRFLPTMNVRFLAVQPGTGFSSRSQGHWLIGQQQSMQGLAEYRRMGTRYCSSSPISPHQHRSAIFTEPRLSGCVLLIEELPAARAVGAVL